MEKPKNLGLQPSHPSRQKFLKFENLWPSKWPTSKKTCELFLQLYGGNKKDFLERIVSEYETMVLYHDPTIKKKAMEWRWPDEKSSS